MIPKDYTSLLINLFRSQNLPNLPCSRPHDNPKKGGSLLELISQSHVNFCNWVKLL